MSGQTGVHSHRERRETMEGASGNPAIEQIRSRVANYLTNASLRFEEMEHGHVVFAYDDEVPGQPFEISVSYVAWGDEDEHTSIVFRSIVLVAAEPSAAFYQYVATHQPTTFGKFRVHTDDDGETMVVYEHQMPADYHDYAEFDRAFDVVFASYMGQSKAAEKELVHRFGESFEEESEIDRIYGAGVSAEQIEHLRSLLERQAVALSQLAELIDMVAKSNLAPPTKARIFSAVAKATDDLRPRLERLIRSD